MVIEEDKQISKHSSGVSIIIRLNGLWTDANNHSRMGLFSKWNADLDTIWRELARDLNETEYQDTLVGNKIKEGYKTEFEKFDRDIAAKGDFEDTGSESFEDTSPELIKKRAEHYKLLMKKDLFLRRLENHLGKGTTFDDGSEDDFD